jgi:putative addiction module CopG family antidote
LVQSSSENDKRACVIVRPENLPFLDFAPTPPASNDKAGLLAMIRVGLNPIKQSEITMRTTQQLSITLPLDMADVVKAKVRTGEYATESEVIRDGLRALLARDRAVESWLNHQVGPAYDALKADPARAVTVDQVRARLAAEHAKAR